ncbi:hypothetical protein D3C79_1029070 [compost metagenome]
MHLADDLFGKQPGLAGDANQDIRLHVARHVQQGEYFAVGVPVFQVVALLHQLVLEREQVWHRIGQQAEAVNHEHPRACQIFA